MRQRLWIWGYVLEHIPGPMMFVDRPTCCSLETATDHLHAEYVVYMDSTTRRLNLDDRLYQHVAQDSRPEAGALK